MNLGGAQAFQFGGTAQVQPGGFGASSGPVVIENLYVSVLAGKEDQTRVFVNGGNTSQGQSVIVKNVKQAQLARISH